MQICVYFISLFAYLHVYYKIYTVGPVINLLVKVWWFLASNYTLLVLYFTCFVIRLFMQQLVLVWFSLVCLCVFNPDCSHLCLSVAAGVMGDISGAVSVGGRVCVSTLSSRAGAHHGER